MKYIKILLIVAVGLLSVAAGLAKVMGAPQEVQFFQALGLSPVLMLPLGILQLGGALSLVFKQSRKIGAFVVALGFLVSSLMIFATGNYIFGLVSFLPVLAALAIAKISSKPPN